MHPVIISWNNHFNVTSSCQTTKPDQSQSVRMPSTGLREEEHVCVFIPSTVSTCFLCVYVRVYLVWKYAMFSNLVEYECMLQVHLLFLALGCYWLRLPQWLCCPHSALIGWLCGRHPATILWVHILRRDLMQSGLLAGLRHQLHMHIRTHFSWQKYTCMISLCVCTYSFAWRHDITRQKIKNANKQNNSQVHKKIRL